jgi:hypothetical protein
MACAKHDRRETSSHGLTEEQDGRGKSGTELDFRLLGSLEVRIGGTSVPIRGVRRRALLARLLLAQGRVVRPGQEGRFVEAAEVLKGALGRGAGRR